MQLPGWGLGVGESECECECVCVIWVIKVPFCKGRKYKCMLAGTEASVMRSAFAKRCKVVMSTMESLL